MPFYIISHSITISKIFERYLKKIEPKGNYAIENCIVIGNCDEQLTNKIQKKLLNEHTWSQIFINLKEQITALDFQQENAIPIEIPAEHTLNAIDSAKKYKRVNLNVIRETLNLEIPSFPLENIVKTTGKTEFTNLLTSIISGTYTSPLLTFVSSLKGNKPNVEVLQILDPNELLKLADTTPVMGLDPESQKNSYVQFTVGDYREFLKTKK
jgi:hypothetical protein